MQKTIVANVCNFIESVLLNVFPANSGSQITDSQGCSQVTRTLEKPTIERKILHSMIDEAKGDIYSVVFFIDRFVGLNVPRHTRRDEAARIINKLLCIVPVVRLAFRKLPGRLYARARTGVQAQDLEFTHFELLALCDFEI